MNDEGAAKAEERTAGEAEALADRGAFGRALFAGGAMLVGSFASLLRYHDYPFASGEVALVSAGLLLVAAVLALAYARTTALGRAVLAGLIAILAVDLNVDRPLVLALGIGLAVAAAAWIRPRETMGTIGVVFAVVLGSALIGASASLPAVKRVAAKQPVAADPARPLVVHLILDEHIGVAGMRRSSAALHGAEGEVEAGAKAAGLQIFPNAYARYYHTVLSLSDFLGRTKATANKFAHLSGMSDAGYDVRLTSSTYFDLCRDPRHACDTYWHARLAAVGASDLPMTSKASVLAFNFAGLSDLTTALSDGIDEVLKRVTGQREIRLKDYRDIHQFNSVEAMRRFAVELRTARPGQARVAHFLLPHSPYSLDEQCRPRPVGEWQLWVARPPLEQRDAAYRRQLRCTWKLVGDVTRAIEQSPARGNYVLVVQGDHGSRIANAEPLHERRGEISAEELARNYSALFAIRTPDGSYGDAEAQLPLASLLKQLRAGGYQRLVPTPADRDPRQVHLEDKNWKPSSTLPLPDWRQ